MKKNNHFLNTVQERCFNVFRRDREAAELLKRTDLDLNRRERVSSLSRPTLFRKLSRRTLTQPPDSKIVANELRPIYNHKYYPAFASATNSAERFCSTKRFNFFGWKGRNRAPNPVTILCTQDLERLGNLQRFCQH